MAAASFSLFIATIIRVSESTEFGVYSRVLLQDWSSYMKVRYTPPIGCFSGVDSGTCLLRSALQVLLRVMSLAPLARLSVEHYSDALLPQPRAGDAG